MSEERLEAGKDEQQVNNFNLNILKSICKIND